MLKILLFIVAITILYFVLTTKQNVERNDEQESHLIQLNDYNNNISQNIKVGDISNHQNGIEYVPITIQRPTQRPSVVNDFLNDLTQAEKGDNGGIDGVNIGIDDNTQIVLDTGLTTIDDKELSRIDIQRLDKIEEDDSTITAELLNQLDVPKLIGDLVIGDVAEKIAKTSLKQTLNILSHMKKNIKNPKIVGQMIDNIAKSKKNSVKILKNLSTGFTDYNGKNIKNTRFMGKTNNRFKAMVFKELIASKRMARPFKGVGSSALSKVSLTGIMKTTGNLSKSVGRMGLKFVKNAVIKGANVFTLASTLVDLIDPFGFENLQSNKQYYRMKRKHDMEWARVIYDEYNEIEREKLIKGISKNEYVPLNTPMYWGPIHEMTVNESMGLSSPTTIENTGDRLNHAKIMTSYMNNLIKIIDREFNRYLNDDANWTEFENKMKNMREYLVCAEVDDYEDVERQTQLNKYFSEWGFEFSDDMWDTYKDFVPKYECKTVPPDVTGALSASKYSEALIEQDLIPYEAAFLYLQIFINFMEKIAIPAAYRMVCEEFPTKWVKNTLSDADIYKFKNGKISEKWDMLEQIEQAIILLGNMRNSDNTAKYTTDHEYIKALMKLYKRLVLSMEITTDSDCTLNYFNDGNFNITQDDINNVRDAINISSEYFNKSYEGNDDIEKWLGGFDSFKLNPEIIGKNKNFMENVGLMLAGGKNKCEPSEYCDATGVSSVPIIGNVFDLVAGNSSCKLKQPSVTFNFEPEEDNYGTGDDSCNINCYTEWIDWDFIRLLNKFKPDIEEYAEKNNIIIDIENYIDIVDDCFEIKSNDDLCDPNDANKRCDQAENQCSLRSGEFKLTETKKQQLRNLGKIQIGNSEFDYKFNQLYDTLITGRSDYRSKKYGVCPLNYCKKNMDRMERDDEIKKIMNSCMYRHKSSCVLNWDDASADMRMPYYYWDDNFNTCFMNKNIWQYRTLCNCATKTGNGLIGRIVNGEVMPPESMQKNTEGKDILIGGATGGIIGASIAATGGFGEDSLFGSTPFGSIINMVKDQFICSDDKSMQAYTCEDLTSLSGEDYNNIGGGLSKPGDVIKSNGDSQYKFGKSGYTKEDREIITKRLENAVEEETDYMKKEKIYMQLELLKNPNLNVNQHSMYAKFKGKFNDLFGCKCGIELEPNTGDWKTDAIRYKKQICKGSLGVNISEIPDRSVEWNDEDHPTYPNACVTNEDFCKETEGCWFHNEQLNPPYGLGDCEIPTSQQISESIFGTSFTRLNKKLVESVPGADNLTCIR